MSFFAPSMDTFAFAVAVLTLLPAAEDGLGRPVGVLTGFVEVFLGSWPGNWDLVRCMPVTGGSSKSEVSESVFITSGTA